VLVLEGRDVGGGVVGETVKAWSVVRVNDDGRHEVVHAGLRGEAASLIAGALRDEQTDQDVGEGWNVVALGAAELGKRNGDVSHEQRTDGR
jgi:hypothetical protein